MLDGERADTDDLLILSMYKRHGARTTGRAVVVARRAVWLGRHQSRSGF